MRELALGSSRLEQGGEPDLKERWARDGPGIQSISIERKTSAGHVPLRYRGQNVNTCTAHPVDVGRSTRNGEISRGVTWTYALAPLNVGNPPHERSPLLTTLSSRPRRSLLAQQGATNRFTMQGVV